MRHLLLPVGIALTFSTVSQAHISLLAPSVRSSTLKQGPCGAGASDPRSSTPTRFRSGETITVSWREYIGHPGHYRIAFDPDGDGLFQDPSSFTDVAPRPGVIKDNIADKSGTQVYTEQVELPDVECTKCTLQVIQVMTDKAPYGDGNDIYYQCADLILARAPASTDAGSLADAGRSPPAANAGSEEKMDANVPNGAAGNVAEAQGGCSATPYLGSWLSVAGLVLPALLLLASRRSATVTTR